jgi:hypothetical protein
MIHLPWKISMTAVGLGIFFCGIITGLSFSQSLLLGVISGPVIVILLIGACEAGADPPEISG